MVRIGQTDLDKKPGIVAAIGGNAIETARLARSMGADILEVRIDLLGIRDADELKLLMEELKEQTGLPVIATNRCRSEGGQWDGTDDARIELLISAIEAADALDVELAASQRQKVIDAAKKAGKTIIISSHNFSATPPKDVMLSTLNHAMDAGADIAKLAVTPNSTGDTLKLLEVTQQADFPVCTIAMGKMGAHTRVVAPLYGSVLTYGAVDEAVAPGQLRIDELKNMLEALV